MIKEQWFPLPKDLRSFRSDSRFRNISNGLNSLAYRDDIVERIHGMLNAQRKPSANLYSRTGWSNLIERYWLRWDAHRKKTTYRMNRR